MSVIGYGSLGQNGRDDRKAVLLIRGSNSGIDRSAMRSRLAILVLAVFAIGLAGARAQTDEDLRPLWQKGNLSGMEQIARTGDSRAEAWMGLMLRNRSRRPESKEWFRRAAEKGDKFALWSLGEMHEQDREYADAAYWYRRGAEAGMGSSATRYADFLLHGRGVGKNEAEALRWYIRGVSSASAFVCQRYRDAPGQA